MGDKRMTEEQKKEVEKWWEFCGSPQDIEGYSLFLKRLEEQKPELYKVFLSETWYFLLETEGQKKETEECSKRYSLKEYSFF